MASIYIASALLCICLYAQAQQEGTLTKLVKVSRVDLGDKFRLIAEYEIDSSVSSNFRATWTQSESVRPLLGSTLEPGRATVEVEKNLPRWTSVNLELGGEWHYLKMEWNIDGSGDRDAALNFDMVKITPGLDISYSTNEVVKVYVAVDENRSKPYLSFSYFDIDVTGSYIVGGHRQGHEEPPFIDQETNSVNHVSTTTLTFHNDDVIDGYFTAYVEGDANRDTLPILSVTEILIFSVHPPGKDVSFAYGYRL